MPVAGDTNTTLRSRTLRELELREVHEQNPFTRLVAGQRVVEVPSLELESGVTISNFPIAYKTWGTLNARGDNCIIICHALTGSSDVSDWWNPLLGRGKAFDPTKFLIVCLNSMGSPYGSFSPLTINEATGRPYGPEFPLCTIRDDVRAHRIVLDSLGVTSVACVIGGSMGGMLALEWTATYGLEYIKNLVALATSARHSAWCISWSEAQRQSIYSDPKYLDGYYSSEDPPVSGLAAARMSALLTYRSRDSFETKFARKSPSVAQQQKSLDKSKNLYQKEASTVSEQSIQIHNDGNQNNTHKTGHRTSMTSCSSDSMASLSSHTSASSATADLKEVKPPQTYFSAQSYLRYQGAKFINRFDANCYIAITRKLDTHDLARDRIEYDEDMEKVLNSIRQESLIIGVKSDGLFTYPEQEYLAQHIPNAKLEKIESPEGHDAFLLEFELINKLIVDFLHKNVRELMSATPSSWNDNIEQVQTSLFGEAEEVTNW